MISSEQARLVISLDFEMYWGLRARPDVKSLVPRLLRVPAVVEATLELFDKYEINATWATVGLLGLKDLHEARSMVPDCRPIYANHRLDTYRDIVSDEIESLPAEILFAPKLVQKITQQPRQELASHSYSHMYCLAEGATPAAFARDLELARQVFKRFGVQPSSFVFPRNQEAPWSFEILAKEKYTTYRAGGKRWVSKGVAKKSVMLRAARVLDSVFPWSMGDLYSSELGIGENDLREVPASRFLRAGRPAKDLYQKLCLNNVMRELDYAAKHQKLYHLWWHPHNFTAHPETSLQHLEAILQHFHGHAEKGRMISSSMSALIS